MRRRLAVVIAAAVVFIIAAIVYWRWSPEASALFPRCPFLILTGWQCPGCGSQRAIHALLHGDLATAWRLNAWMVGVLPIIAALLVVQVAPAGWLLRLRAFSMSPTLHYTILIITIAWFIGRNIL